ncbi:MAG TPA: SigE family RNA polymerase sigma factor [Candidatus Limnocylindrales bacterium]
MRNADGFDACYRSTSRRLLSYAYALTGDWAQAQDLVQEAYLRAWRQWDRLSGYDDVEAWLRLVVSRLATDAWRRLARWRKVLRLSHPLEQCVDGPSEQTVLLTRALAALPAGQRQAIAMHYLMDLSVNHIAEELGTSPNTIKSWLARGRASLADALTDRPESPVIAISSLGCDLP